MMSLGNINTHRWRYMVVLHFNYNIVVHSQFGCFSNCRTNDNANRKCSGFSRTNRYILWYTRRWLYNDIFSCEYSFFKCSAVFFLFAFYAISFYFFQTTISIIVYYSICKNYDICGKKIPCRFYLMTECTRCEAVCTHFG